MQTIDIAPFRSYGGKARVSGRKIHGVQLQVMDDTCFPARDVVTRRTISAVAHAVQRLVAFDFCHACPRHQIATSDSPPALWSTSTTRGKPEGPPAAVDEEQRGQRRRDVNERETAAERNLPWIVDSTA